MGRQFSDMQLQLFIGHGGAIKDSQLLKFDGKGLHKADNYGFLGVGDSALLRFLAETLYLTDLSEDEGMNLAIYLIQKATDYIDWCGGPIDVGFMNWAQECVMLPQDEIQRRIKSMEKQESKLTDLIIRQPFSSLPT
jgi:20S proteasome alpha/beta subunit